MATTPVTRKTHRKIHTDENCSFTGTVDIATLKLAGTTMTSSAAELNYLDITAAGTVDASKAVVVDANKDVSSFRGVGMTGTLTRSGTTGNNIDALTDNLADALSIKEGSNAYLTFVTTDNSESIAVKQRLTATDGVASGTARVVGGQAYSAVSATDNLLASAGATAHVDFAQTYSIPANTLKAGSHAKIRAMVQVTDASGTDTLEVKLYIGGTTLVTTTAFDPDGATDYVIVEFDLWSNAAPGAAVGLKGYGHWLTSDGGSETRGAAILAVTNHATNGALIVKASAKWSATTASTNARLTVLDVEIL